MDNDECQVEWSSLKLIELYTYLGRYVHELVGACVRAYVLVPVNSFMVYEYYTAQFWL